MSTQKKINRPSDDPVIAIRALRLRSNVSQVTQYYEKNIPDAESWMEITESALTVVSSVLTDMIEQCTKGSSEKLTTSDRQTILDELKQLRDEVYSTGNADYAGRSVFTGYRTETTLKFTAAETKTYSITEQLGSENLDKITYVNSANLNNINEVNFGNAEYAGIVEQDIEEAQIYRMRLAYSNIDNGSVLPVIKTFDAVSGDFVAINSSADTEIISQTSTPNPYDVMKSYEAANESSGTPTDHYILIPETGELLMTKSAYEKLMLLKDDVTTATTNEAEIQIEYRKSTWELNDLKPEHYFACTTDPGTPDAVIYNADYLQGIHEKQSIEYDVGLNQSIKVNTTADEVFTHDIGRDVDDMITAMQEVTDMEATVSRLTAIAEKYPDPNTTEYQTIHKQLDAANKGLAYLKEKCQKTFEGSITKMQNHLNVANYATTNCGTREKKLSLIKNRLMSQKTNFETLQSDNENIDLSDVAIQLSGAELTYQAALMSVSKIMQTSLMNYI
jgi:flagellar hook-associated protein 3 FlgL